MAGPEQTGGIIVQGSKTSPGRGRSLRAVRTFQPGQQIALFASPLVVIPSGPTAKSVCNQCLTPELAVKACTGCRAVAYCGAPCQKAHWSVIHKLECRAFKRVRSKVAQDWLPTAVRAAVQILLRWEDSAVRAAVGGLLSNVEAFREKKQAFEDLGIQSLAACTYAGWETTEQNLQLGLEILCKIQTNSFDRGDINSGYSGTFLDSLLSNVNHSCIPNAVVAFAKRKAYLRAEAPIKVDDEIIISYIDYTKPKIFRQHGLELYHFECDCHRCAHDLDVYQVCQASPLLPLNSFSFVPNMTALRKPAIDTKLSKDAAFRARIDKIYVACAPEAKVSAEQRLANLRLQWEHCQPLVKAQTWALEPLAQIFQQAIIYYAGQENYLYALVIECFVALHISPYQYVAPFKQSRLEGLLMIAKTITNTALPSELGFKGIDPGVVAALQQTDEGSLYHAILLMFLHYGPMAHSDEWETLAAARAMLQDIESLEGREKEAAILREWLKNPKHPAADTFFRQRAIEPVSKLAAFAIDILEADLEPQTAVGRT